MRAACLLAACLLTGIASSAAARAREAPTVADLYPFIALVATRDAPLCTGALVAPHAVLTSASCIEAASSAPDLVFLGTYNIFLDEFRRDGHHEILRVDKVVVHPGFDPADAQQNNLALLLLNRDSRHAPVALPEADFPYPLDSTSVLALGYGSLSADGFFPQLHADELTLLPQAECGGLQTAYGRWWATAPPDGGPAVQACTGLSHSFRACASGNAGAPLLLPAGGAPRGKGGPLQLGLLTSGFSCSTDRAVASASSPALYTWLPRYADWLGQQLRRAGGAEQQDAA